MRKTKILVTIPWSGAGAGGVEKVVSLILNSFPRDNFDINVLAIVDSSVDESVVRNCFRSDIKTKTITATMGKLSFLKLRREIKEIKPDVILSNNLLQATNVVIAKLLSFHRAKIIFVNHGINFSRLLHLAQLYFNYFFSKKVITVSYGLKDFMVKKMKLNAEKISVIYNPFNTQELRKKSDEIIPKQDIVWDENIRTIVYVGRLREKEKDVATLLRAIAVFKEKEEVNLLIIGDGEDKEKLKSLAENLNINSLTYFLGWKDNPYPFVKKSRVLVLTSKAEGFGRVLVEAMALGTPVVSTDCPSGPVEILENGKYGKLAPVGDHVALAQAIKETLDNPPDSELLKKRAEDFSYEKIIDQYLNIIEEELKT